MNLETALSLVRGGRLRLLWHVTGLFKPFYRLSFAAAAVRSGVVGLLAAGPRGLEALATELAPGQGGRASLAAWLDVGVGLGELGHDGDGYHLKGFLLRRLAEAGNDDIAALVEEVATFHHRLILETPTRLRAGRLWDPSEHDGDLIARSSRIMEPFIFQTIDWALPATGPLRLLEVGCGSGTYLRHAAERNPALQAVGVELQPHVAATTRAAIERWGLHDRVHIEAGDVRELAGGEPFDVVTLYNVIYYVAVADRVPLLRLLASRLVPGGRLILTTSCRGGSPGMRVLDLWTSSTPAMGPLPDEEELLAQLREAGFTEIAVKHVIPGEPYIALHATAAAPPLPT